ncbi:TetR/AcrR family transcriptional regulator [Hamadaea tsunoensis]|uniref:TetR/AcrR family transcriptional regulator n=1 Tax=Hamadaea tsunoensis TaxID=53368 RepID=UPI00040689A1|nr:TetR/AcrR family transcriptional regulator [Hamadaea tsunoensis]
MPTPDRTSLDEIIRTGREILESDGLGRLTMQAVADRVGVRAPSLYKRVRNRDDLVRLIAEAILLDLTGRLEAVADGGDPRRELGRLAHALRAFAHAQPAGYRLVFTWGPPDPATLTRSSAPILRVAARLAGPDHALPAARTITAWAHGFIGMELAGAFNLGGDLDVAFDFGIAALAEALTAAGTA